MNQEASAKKPKDTLLLYFNADIVIKCLLFGFGFVLDSS